jgi:hypothetical protein
LLSELGLMAKRSSLGPQEVEPPTIGEHAVWQLK